MRASSYPPQITNVKGFTERLRLLRTARGLKQNRLAELLGIPARSYNRWERGTYVPHVEMLVKLAEVVSRIWLKLVEARLQRHDVGSVRRRDQVGRVAAQGFASRRLSAG